MYYYIINTSEYGYSQVQAEELKENECNARHNGTKELFKFYCEIGKYKCMRVLSIQDISLFPGFCESRFFHLRKYLFFILLHCSIAARLC